MRSLKGGIPRGFKDGRSHDARAYRRYCVSVKARLSALPIDAMPTLREAGRCVVELERLGAALDDAVERHRRRDASRLRRQLVTLRTQLLNLERRLEERAGLAPSDPLAGVRRAIQEARR